MAVQVFIFSDTVKQDVDRLVKNAEENILGIFEIKQIRDGNRPPPGDDEKFVMYAGGTMQYF